MTPTKAKKKIVVRDEVTGLKIAEDGKKLIVENKKDAVTAITETASLQERIDKLTLKLTPLNAQKELLRAGLRDYQVKKEIKEIRAGGWASLLIERTKSLWVLREQDIPQNLDVTDLEEPIIPFFDILKKKFPDVKQRNRVLNRITKRVIDPQGVDVLVKDEIFTAEEVAPAFVQFIETSYVTVAPEKK